VVLVQFAAEICSGARLAHIWNELMELTMLSVIIKKSSLLTLSRHINNVHDKVNQEEQVGAPTVPSAAPSLEGPMNLKTFSVTNMSKCHMVSQCVTSISFLNKHI
jgi:hypothetical protein